MERLARQAEKRTVRHGTSGVANLVWKTWSVPVFAQTLESLTSDDIKLAAVERILERIVMRAIDVNEHLISELSSGKGRTTRLTYRDTFLTLFDLGTYDRGFAEQIARSAGLRNILVHEYNDVDRKIVHSSIESCLRDYYRYIEYVHKFIASR